MAARTAPPTTGTPTSSLKVDSVANWMRMTGQFADVTSAPRFSVDFRVAKSLIEWGLASR